MNKKIIKGVLLGIILFFFLPFFTVSCGIDKVSLSGLNIAFGKAGTGYSDKNMIFILVLLLPVTAFAVQFIPKFKKLEDIISIVCSSFSLVLLSFAQIYAIQQSKKFLVSSETELGFFLSVIGHIIVVGNSILNIRLKRNMVGETAFQERIGFLSKNNLRKLGYIIFAGITFIFVLKQLSKGVWHQVFLGLVLIGMALVLYFILNKELNSPITIKLRDLLQQLNDVLEIIKISENIRGYFENLLYVFLGIVLINSFYTGNVGIATFLIIIYSCSLYLLFISILILLAEEKYDLVLHGIWGYLSILSISFLRTGLFASNIQINFLSGFKILLYWTLLCYFIDYKKIVSKEVKKSPDEPFLNQV